MFILEVEKPLLELEDKIKEIKKVNLTGKIDLSREIKALEVKADLLKKNIYENLTSWDRVLMARHPLRPTTLDIISGVFTDFFEMHGDRLMGDDSAIVGGLAHLDNHTIMIIGHQKGKDTKDNVVRNFGMANPQGFRKAYRLLSLAEKFSIPVVTLVNTPGAYPGIEAEERGQFEAISRNISLLLRLPVPVLVFIVGEGGSGGALAIGVGDRVIMLENSIYSVISPEGCASILWRDSSKAPDAAESLNLTAERLLALGIIDEIIPEPLGGIHRDPSMVYTQIKESILKSLAALAPLSGREIAQGRYDKFRSMGVFGEDPRVQ